MIGCSHSKMFKLKQFLIEALGGILHVNLCKSESRVWFCRALAGFMALVQIGCSEGADAARATAPSSNVLVSPGLHRYIVLFRPKTANPGMVAAYLVRDYHAQIAHTFEFAVQGFSADLPDAAVTALRKNPLVMDVSPVQKLHAESTQSLPLTGASYQASDLWDLDRIDERSAQFDGGYGYDYCGDGVHIYIVDSGIRGGHSEWGYSRIGTSVAKIS